MYVMAVDISSLNEATESITWRFYNDEEAALDAWYRARALAESGRYALEREKRVQVIAARLYEVDQQSREAARDAVLAGNGKALKDTEDALVGIPEEAKTLDSLLG